MIVETANVNAGNGVEKRQRVTLKLRLGASDVSEVDFVGYDVKRFDIVLGKRWMCDINCHHQIDHDSNKMWVADKLWEKREEDRVHYLPGLLPVDVDERIMEQAKFMGIPLIRKAEVKNLSACLLRRAFLIKVHHRGDRGTLQPDEPPGEFQEMLTEFQGLFGEPTYSKSQNERQADFDVKTDPNGKILFWLPYRITRGKK